MVDAGRRGTKKMFLGLEDFFPGSLKCADFRGFCKNRGF